MHLRMLTDQAMLRATPQVSASLCIPVTTEVKNAMLQWK